MARKASGAELAEKAGALLKNAKTANDLRQLQAVYLPISFGLTIKQTAKAIGVTTGWACQLRRDFIRQKGDVPSDKKRQGGRRRQNMSLEYEKKFLNPFFEKAKSGGILVVGEIKQALDKKLGRKTALASVYNLLHRHNWRKLAPDKRHVKTDVDTQEEWKKNLQKRSKK